MARDPVFSGKKAMIVWIISPCEAKIGAAVLEGRVGGEVLPHIINAVCSRSES
jgi:hypothetical protein